MLKRTFIWSKSLRIAHWLMAFSVIGLLVTGWFQGHVINYFQVALDYHYLLAYLLVIALVLRFYLLFSSSRSAAGLHDLLPNKTSINGIVAMLRFYVSFGRTPLPHWYAHNPLWAPLYIVLFILLVLQIVTGFLIGSGHHTIVISLFTLHNHISSVIGWIIFLHVLTVVVQDLKGGNSDISAMIHGYRIFQIDKPDLGNTSQTVSLDILKRNKPD